ncbi:MAG: hypothetical protein LH645_04285 [Actinomycetia bacterium]|nr:hypothetical protein [Actinomycetes bacterium]
MNAEPGRVAAYADLVAAVLDLRSPGPRQAFDAALSEAVAAGTVTDDLARQLRWLQRASERAIVEHAEAVLPPALNALQTTVSSAPAPSALAPLVAAAQPPQPAMPTPSPDPVGEPASGTGSPEPEGLDAPEAAPVVQLQARRLLVAGLRPLPDPVHRGTLP